MARKKVTKPAESTASAMGLADAKAINDTAAKMQADRAKDVHTTDDLPEMLRLAIRNCPFNITAPVLRRGVDVATLLRMVEEVRTDKDAAEVNRVIATQINNR